MIVTESRFSRGVYAGSFDPLTNGHMYIITQGSKLFNELIIAIGSNYQKKYTFSLEKRLYLLRESTKHLKNVKIDSYENQFLIRYAEKVNSSFIIRGIRTESDYEYERTMRNINGELNPDITTLFLMPPKEVSEVSSSIVKGMVGTEGWEEIVKNFVPEPVYQTFLEQFSNQ